MIRSILGGAAGIIAAPAVGGLVWRTARQRRVAKALEIDTPNGIVEQRFIKVSGIDQWIQLRGEDRDNPAFAAILAIRRQQPALRRGRQYLRDISGDGQNFGSPPNARRPTSLHRRLVEDPRRP